MLFICYYDTHISRTSDHQRWRHFEHKHYFVLHACTCWICWLFMLPLRPLAAISSNSSSGGSGNDSSRATTTRWDIPSDLTAALLAPYSIVGCTPHYTHVLQFSRTKPKQLQRTQQHDRETDRDGYGNAIHFARISLSLSTEQEIER